VASPTIPVVRQRVAVRVVLADTGERYITSSLFERSD